jgi:hypothetical protein
MKLVSYHYINKNLTTQLFVKQSRWDGMWYPRDLTFCVLYSFQQPYLRDLGVWLLVSLTSVSDNNRA